jgi:hypothetical protein
MITAILKKSPQDYEEQQESLSILRSLTMEEGIALDRDECFPGSERIAEIAKQVGCPPGTVENVFRGYLPLQDDRRLQNETRNEVEERGGATDRHPQVSRDTNCYELTGHESLRGETIALNYPG